MLCQNLWRSVKTKKKIFPYFTSNTPQKYTTLVSSAWIFDFIVTTNRQQHIEPALTLGFDCSVWEAVTPAVEHGTPPAFAAGCCSSSLSLKTPLVESWQREVFLSGRPLLLLVDPRFLNAGLVMKEPVSEQPAMLPVSDMSPPPVAPSGVSRMEVVESMELNWLSNKAYCDCFMRTIKEWKREKENNSKEIQDRLLIMLNQCKSFLVLWKSSKLLNYISIFYGLKECMSNLLQTSFMSSSFTTSLYKWSVYLR